MWLHLHNHGKNGLRTVGIIILTVALSTRVSSSPGLNTVPTADILGASQVRLGYESDGGNWPYANGHTEYIYTGYGIGGRFQLNIDFYDVRRACNTYYSATYLIQKEEQHQPALAIGVENVSRVSQAGYYAVGYRTSGKARLHFGVQRQGAVNSLILGVDYVMCRKLTFLVDWQSGEGFFSGVGIFWQATPNVGIQLYAVHNNTEPASDYMGLYAGYTFPLM